MIAFNVLMYRFFVLSMQARGAGKATIYNFAVNFVQSVINGYLLFGESITFKNLIGLTLVLSGTFIISTCDQDHKDDQVSKEAKKTN